MSPPYSPPYPAAELDDNTRPTIATGQVTRSLLSFLGHAEDDHGPVMRRHQRDLADPISPHEPLPGLLPVGYSEAETRYRTSWSSSLRMAVAGDTFLP